MTITDAARKLRAREVSSVELAQDALRKIHDAQPRLNAFITVTEDLALEQARRADEEFARGIDRGPLQGIPYSLKDNFETAGIRTTAGSRIFADYVPGRDSAVYERYRAAGAVLMGKNGLHELAYGITSENPHFGAIHNPRDLTRSPGGSSGGSGAAVAAGLVFFSIGSDTGGSIRIPAAWCGCVGFKPTFGFLDTRGLMPLGVSFDTAGPLTRSVEDAALVLGLRMGPVPAGLRVGVAENFFHAPELPPGIEPIPVTVPDPEETNVIGRLILMAEAAAMARPYLGRRSDFGADVLALFDRGLTVSAVDYLDAQRRADELRAAWKGVWERVDVLVTPTVPMPAPRIGDADQRAQATSYVRPFNVMRLPAISLPVSARFGAGMQLAGPFGRDRLVLDATHAFSTCLVAQA